MILYKYPIIFALLGASVQLAAQDSGIPLQSPAANWVQREDILGRAQHPIHSEIQPFSRRDAAYFALAIDTLHRTPSRLDKADLKYIFNDNSEWVEGTTSQPAAPAKVYADSSRTFYSIESGQQIREARVSTREKPLLGIFYRTPANFFEVNTKYFMLRANPMLHVGAGMSLNDTSYIFNNQRGVELRGSIDRRLFFYTSVLESQVRFPDYVTDRVETFEAVPNAGAYKPYNSEVFNVRNGYDFNNAVAYVGCYATKHIGVQLGHGRHFIGNGYRSLFLSDFGNNYFYLKLSTNVWRFHYQNLFMELTPSSARADKGQNLLPKKYAAVHYLHFRLLDNLSFGFFEATVFNRGQHFELQYLNPVILYRSVEGMIGSPDNVLIGLDGKWNFLHRFQLYGQVLLDEFKFENVINARERGWWANKFGIQAGAKYINAFGIDHLDIQAEFNQVRPYTYSHRDTLNSYTHYHQALAHPLWSNFREICGIVRYQPLPRLQLSARVIRIYSGENTAIENWGANPLLPSSTRVMEYGNSIGQGVGGTTLLAGLDASWALYHNLFIDARALIRRRNSDSDALDRNTTIFSVGVRMNAWSQNLDF